MRTSDISRPSCKRRPFRYASCTLMFHSPHHCERAIREPGPIELAARHEAKSSAMVDEVLQRWHEQGDDASVHPPAGRSRPWTLISAALKLMFDVRRLF